MKRHHRLVMCAGTAALASSGLQCCHAHVGLEKASAATDAAVG
jgi:hypothetical protein